MGIMVSFHVEDLILGFAFAGAFYILLTVFRDQLF